MLLRADGRMIRAMTIMGIGAILNIILDPIFILLFPSWGIKAVAVATLISQILQCVLTLGYFIYQSPEIRWSRPQLRPGMLSSIVSV